jgi:uncharacterized membrane protein YdjX (TVP38/TMEM64 family)
LHPSSFLPPPVIVTGIELSLCFLLYGLLGLTPFPSDPLTLAIFAWQGPVPALCLGTLGNTLSALVEFFIGGTVRDLTAFEQRRAKLPLHLDRLPVGSPLFLFLGRMVPGVGAKFVGVAGGLYKVPLFTYVWTAVAANFIGALGVVLGALGVLRLFH